MLGEFSSAKPAAPEAQRYTDMKMHCRFGIAIATMLLMTSAPSQAIVGCLSDLDDVTQRAEVIAVVDVREVTITSEKTCQAASSHPPVGGERCGEIAILDVEPKATLKGTAHAGPIRILLEGAAWTCDDRTEPHSFVPSLKGTQVILFLERQDGLWWSLDGPDSIYLSNYEATVHTILNSSSLRLSFEINAKSSPRGTVLPITYTIMNAGKSRFLGCVGSLYSSVFSAGDQSTYDRSESGISPHCQIPLDLQPGVAVQWSHDAFVPSNTPPGPVLVRARVQLLSLHECDGQPCGHAFLEASGGPVDVTTALEQSSSRP